MEFRDDVYCHGLWKKERESLDDNIAQHTVDSLINFHICAPQFCCWFLSIECEFGREWDLHPIGQSIEQLFIGVITAKLADSCCIKAVGCQLL